MLDERREQQLIALIGRVDDLETRSITVGMEKSWEIIAALFKEWQKVDFSADFSNLHGEVLRFTENTLPTPDDALFLINDADGTSGNNFITLANLFGSVPDISFNATNRYIGLVSTGTRALFKTANMSFYGANNDHNNIGMFAGAGKEAGFIFKDGVTSKWQLAKIAANEFMLYGYAASAVAFYVAADNDIGIGTTTPSKVFDVNQGAGNMIADGYDNHSLAEYKEDIDDVDNILDALIKAPPKKYKRIPHVPAGEIKLHLIDKFGTEKWIEEFGGELKDEHITGDDYRGGKLRNITDKKMLAEADKFADSRRAELRKEDKWKQEHIGLVADDPKVLENLPSVISRDKEGNTIGISLSEQIGMLHAGLIELAERVL